MRISDWSSDVCSSDLQHYSHCAPRVHSENLAIQRAVVTCCTIRGSIPIRSPIRETPYTGGCVPTPGRMHCPVAVPGPGRSEEHTSELQSLMRISYAVFYLKKKTRDSQTKTHHLHNAHRTSLTTSN